MIGADIHRAGRAFGAAATLALTLCTAMCAERGGAKIKTRPATNTEAGAAGDASGTVPGTNDKTMGSRGGSGGTASGDATGQSGQSTAGSGGALDGNAGSGGTAGGGETDNGSAGAAASGGTSPDAGGRGGAAGRGGASGSGGAGGSAGMPQGGAAGDCGSKTSCCSPDDPPCIDGCPLNADYCCDARVGARLPCKPVTGLDDIVCMNSCTGTSYGTGSCDQCVDSGDPPCTDASWDDACETGGYAYCSDPVAGFRAGCDGGTAGSYYAYVICTCSPSAACVPTPCCSGSSASCESGGCDPAAGYCCNATDHYEEVCTDYSGTVGTQQFICLNDCTGRSYGTGSCAACVAADDPLCDANHRWIGGCNQDTPVYCSDPVAGYRLRCIETQSSDGTKLPNIDVVCSCDSGA